MDIKRRNMDKAIHSLFRDTTFSLVRSFRLRQSFVYL